jgi:hypothetical protein
VPANTHVYLNTLTRYGHLKHTIIRWDTQNHCHPLAHYLYCCMPAEDPRHTNVVDISRKYNAREATEKQ